MKDWKVMNVEVMTILAFFEIQVSCSFEYLHIALACLYCTLSQNTPFETPHKHRAHISDGVDLTVHVMHTKNRHLHLFQHQPGNAQFIAESHVNFGTVYYQNIKID